MGQTKNRRSVKRHRLLVYERIGSRMRTVPFLLAGITAILYGLGWLSTQDFMQSADISLLQLIWKNQLYLFIILFVCGAVYFYGFVTGRMSYVEARPKSLRVQAGLLAINISYRRIKQIRLAQVGTQYPEDILRGADADLIDPLLSTSCTLVDMKSWPSPGYAWLRRLWSRFMFSNDGVSLMLVAPDAMVLNQQIDSRVAVLQAQSNQSQYLDPLERAVQAQEMSGRHRL
jgi:hypothetical protein